MSLSEAKCKRAIQSCRNKIEHHYEHTRHKRSKAIENEHTKIKALKKQIPEKLDYEADGYDENGNLIYDTAYCRRCRHKFEVDYDEHAKYCPDCGQALDWSDVE